MTRATFEMPLADLGLSTRALGALDRIDVITVDDLLRTHPRRLLRLPGVGHKTRREIGTATKLLREKLGEAPETPLRAAGATDTTGPTDPATLQALAGRVTGARLTDKASGAVVAAATGLDLSAASIQASDEQIRAAQTAFDGVREEADVGRQREALVPLLMDDVAPPIGFGRVQAAHLQAWDGDPKAPDWVEVVESVQRLVGRRATPLNARRRAQKSTRGGSSPGRRWLIAGLAAAVLVLKSIK
jgi:hypothetical protein